MSTKRVDAIQPAIVEALRDVGAQVLDIHDLGHGAPDILVGFRGQLYLMEIKAPGGRLTQYERRWHEEWLGPVYIVHSLDEALAAIGAEVVSVTREVT